MTTNYRNLEITLIAYIDIMSVFKYKFLAIFRSKANNDSFGKYFPRRSLTLRAVKSIDAYHEAYSNVRYLTVLIGVCES